MFLYSSVPCNASSEVRINDAALRLWPAETWPQAELLPLREYHFGDFTVFGPQQYERYLSQLYEANWRTVAYRMYDHKNELKRTRVIRHLPPQIESDSLSTPNGMISFYFTT